MRLVVAVALVVMFLAMMTLIWVVIRLNASQDKLRQDVARAWRDLAFGHADVAQEWRTLGAADRAAANAEKARSYGRLAADYDDKRG